MAKPLTIFGVICPVMMLASCGAADDATGEAEADPVAEQALNDQIMVDPDLANQNEANAALTGGTDQSIPPENMTQSAINAAREAAFALIGDGDKFKDLPVPKDLGETMSDPLPLTAAARAAATPGAAKCAENVQYSASWAAKLPADFPVYPRGTTKEAAGTDADNCSLRVVKFLTPVPLKEVLTFYYSRAVSAGYSSDYVIQAGDHIISGRRGRGSYHINGRELPSGLTEIDLITNGN